MPKLYSKKKGLKRYFIELSGQCFGNFLSMFGARRSKRRTENKKKLREKKTVKFERLSSNDSIYSPSVIQKTTSVSHSFDIFYDAIEIKSMYSRSEDTEEIFSDCETWSCTQQQSESESESESKTSPVLTIKDDENFEEEEIDMSSQKSLITHILGQLRIGMDLEKITMPAFILESRSILGCLNVFNFFFFCTFILIL